MRRGHHLCLHATEVPADLLDRGGAPSEKMMAGQPERGDLTMVHGRILRADR